MSTIHTENSQQSSDSRPPVRARPNINPHVRKWIDECVEMCQPSDVFWCDGSAEQKQVLIRRGMAEGVLIELNQQKLPGCYLHRSNPNDVARSEQATFICTPGQDMAGPTNNWMEPRAAYAKLKGLFTGCMKGRAMYVVPFVMGPIGSPLARVGIELTDSVYVAISMGIMTRMGNIAWKQLDASIDPADPSGAPDFTRCLHSIGDC
jgi:phosphoenolpyruvate carboxykinase (GTP)